jgi:hypothetical protein
MLYVDAHGRGDGMAGRVTNRARRWIGAAWVFTACAAACSITELDLVGTSCPEGICPDGSGLVCLKGTCLPPGGDPCQTQEDCTGPQEPCRYRACEDGRCTIITPPAGSPTEAQAPGDCKVQVCDGQGSAETVADPSDALVGANECIAHPCVGGEQVLTGAACDDLPNGVCDDVGACVECTDSAQCSGEVCTSRGYCVPVECDDQMMNGVETDEDCGGTDCAPCPLGGTCSVDADCQSGSCTGGSCTATCADEVANQGESDVDCGGPCPGCPASAECYGHADCQSKICSAGTCQEATCSDLTKNGAETDIDCGGGACSTCGDLDDCLSNTDCTSKVCSGGVCQPPSCSDGVQNSEESDVDCGGPTSCQRCALEKKCFADADCAAGLSCDTGAFQGKKCLPAQ